MALWQAFVVLGILALMVLIFCNVVLPPFINKPFFFMFRKAERKLLDADQDFSDSMTEAKAEQIRKGVELISDQTKYSRDYKKKEQSE